MCVLCSWRTAVGAHHLSACYQWQWLVYLLSSRPPRLGSLEVKTPWSSNAMLLGLALAFLYP